MQLANDHDYWVENDLRRLEVEREQTREIHEHYQFRKDRMPKYVPKSDRTHPWKSE